MGALTARRPLTGHCAYCGLPTPTPPLCRGHDDLPAGDPLYDLADALLQRLEEVLIMAPQVDTGGSIVEYEAGDGDYACPECGKRIVKISYLGGACYVCPACQV